MAKNTHVVYLIGVDHRIQYTNNSCGPEWKSDIQTLENYLVSKVTEFGIELLAEEFSQECIEWNNASGCTVRDAAERCEKTHLFCDPTTSERASLGINTPDMREKYWMEKIKGSEASSVLFVCGDDHLESFSEILKAQGIEAQIVSQGWGKDWMFKE